VVKPYFGSKERSSTDTLATIWIDRLSGWVCIRTPYNADFINELKEKIPKQHRKWDAELKLWRIGPHYLEDIILVGKKYFKVDVLPEITSGDSSPFERLVKHLSKNGIKQVWRVVAKELHPDAGGDTRKFIEAKDAYDEIIKGHG